MLLRLLPLLLFLHPLMADSFHPMPRRQIKAWTRKLVSQDVQDREWIVDQIATFPIDNYTIVRSKKKLYHLPKTGQGNLEVKRGGDYRNLLRQGMVVVDVGAHIGTHTLTMAEAVGRRGKVIAFEPTPTRFCELFHNVSLNKYKNVQLNWTALGDRTGEIKMELGSSVGLRTLDSYTFPKVSLIKMDVNGREEAFFKGAKETIERCTPILIIESREGRHEWIEKIEEMGYTIENMQNGNIIAKPRKNTDV